MGMYVGETEQVRYGNDFKPFHRHVLSEKSDILLLLFFLSQGDIFQRNSVTLQCLFRHRSILRSFQRPLFSGNNAEARISRLISTTKGSLPFFPGAPSCCLSIAYSEKFGGFWILALSRNWELGI